MSYAVVVRTFLMNAAGCARLVGQQRNVPWCSSSQVERHDKGLFSADETALHFI